MILLDTSVVSEPLRSSPDPHVVAWLDAQPLETLFLSVVTVAELRYGVTLLPPGRRRNGMITQMENQILPYFAGRVLNLDLAARHSFAEAMSTRKPRATRWGCPTASLPQLPRPMAWWWLPTIPPPLSRWGSTSSIPGSLEHRRLSWRALRFS